MFDLLSPGTPLVVETMQPPAGAAPLPKRPQGAKRGNYRAPPSQERVEAWQAEVQALRAAFVPHQRHAVMSAHEVDRTLDTVSGLPL